MNANSSEDSGSRTAVRILPIVRKMCQQVDEIFFQYAGAVGPKQSSQSIEFWLKQGKVSATGVFTYIDLLALHLPTMDLQARFTEEARERVMQQATGGNKI